MVLILLKDRIAKRLPWHAGDVEQPVRVHDGPMPNLFGSDAYAPEDVAARVLDVGVAKARLPALTLGFAASRLLGGLVFSLGLILVTVAGAELFTGNNLIVMAWAGGKVSTVELLRNWAMVCVANLIGASGLALLVTWSGLAAMNQGDVGRAAMRIALTKAELPWVEAFFRGVLCNVLVCMAVWMAMAGRSVTDKVLAILFPISAFVAAGFEHSIANMFYFPWALLLGAPLNALDMARSLAVVIAGNIVGGSVLVALVYWVVYLRRHGRT